MILAIVILSVFLIISVLANIGFTFFICTYIKDWDEFDKHIIDIHDKLK